MEPRCDLCVVFNPITFPLAFPDCIHDLFLSPPNLFVLFHSCVVNGYVEEMRRLACQILELLGEGLKLEDTGIFSRLIRDSKSDSLLRLNHYPAAYSNSKEEDENRIGFGEHTDPQILTLLRSNVGGLQIMNRGIASDNGVWVPVRPNPMAFCVHVGDVLQVGLLTHCDQCLCG